ncbi:MAG: imidazole glycerol phosphate synthase subunit HisH [Candidatus Marinimicrobia bacterium]|nr:imidazole glycerol phosphate synthase subunit HisH [Candidatus Neomarinimicrobiota bacterium]
MIGLIDYGGGNITSVSNALDRLGVNYVKGSTPSDFAGVDKIIFPGVGEAKTAMDAIGKGDLIPYITSLEIPFLGICIGLQILFDYTDERSTKCMGIIQGKLKKFDSKDNKVPQIGWNRVLFSDDSPLFHGIEDGAYFYFVNSYYAPEIPETIAITEYGINFSSVVNKDNYYGVQFHTEKSGEIGEKLLKNFIELC